MDHAATANVPRLEINAQILVEGRLRERLEMRRKARECAALKMWTQSSAFQHARSAQAR